MYTPFDVSPQALAEEAAAVQRKLGAGIATLRGMDDVHYGVTAREEVWRDGKVVLYRFKGERAPTAKIPVLICYALVNRPYMVDLQDDRSLVKNLLALGEDVYLIDWGYTDRSDRFRTLEDYIEVSSAARWTTCARRMAWTRSTCWASARAARSR